MNYNSIDISILFPLKFLEFEPISSKKNKKQKTTVVSITFNKKSPRILSIYNLVLV
jgi:hypothetical protein